MRHTKTKSDWPNGKTNNFDSFYLTWKTFWSCDMDIAILRLSYSKHVPYAIGFQLAF